MIILHGHGGFRLLDPTIQGKELETLLFNSAKMLLARKYISAANLLKNVPFEIFEGTNDWDDDFYVLIAFIPLNKYEELRALSEDDEGRFAFRKIADVISEIGPYIRFIACELIQENPGLGWQGGNSNAGNKIESNKKLPMAICAIVNEILSGSHADLNDLFKNAGAPGDPPELAHSSKWKTWLLRASEDPNIDVFSVLGKVIEEFMEVEPIENGASPFEIFGQDIQIPSAHSIWIEKKQRLEKVLQKNGLQYIRGGRIIETGAGLASEAMVEIIKRQDFSAVEVEFRRTMQTVEDDPGVAITAGCALLEALFKAYLEANGIELPGKQTIKPLWSLVQKEIGFDPKDHVDTDIQRILSGMTSIVDGVGAMRTHGGSAHGGGKIRYRMKPRHARLLINSAHTIALFLIETWKERKEQNKAEES